jgi:hyperosmotically inducible protein
MQEMKKHQIAMKKIISICSAIILGLTLLGAGCAGTATERSTGESIDDTTITARVKGALHGDNLYKFPDVKVTTFKGTVQLSGFVDARPQIDRAVELARTVSGVREVQNNMTVK